MSAQVAKGAAQLDVSGTHLRLFAPLPPGKDGRAREFRLNAKLARQVAADEARAKWRSKASQLVVTIPVVVAGAK